MTDYFEEGAFSDLEDYEEEEEEETSNEGWEDYGDEGEAELPDTEASNFTDIQADIYYGGFDSWDSGIDLNPL